MIYSQNLSENWVRKMNKKNDWRIVYNSIYNMILSEKLTEKMSKKNESKMTEE